MTRYELVEEYHVSVYVPRGLPAAASRAARRALARPSFRARLERTARDVLQRYPSLAKAACRVTR